MERPPASAVMFSMLLTSGLLGCGWYFERLSDQVVLPVPASQAMTQPPGAKPDVVVWLGDTVDSSTSGNNQVMGAPTVAAGPR